jgi:cytochrome d ubiquinol oxidase subunit II
MMGPFDIFDIHVFWFALLGVLLTGYAILDGFDLGVGILHLFVRTDEERRVLMSSIGPLWDGNAVWLVTFGGALFAAFPEAYATAFSGFYLPFMVLLFALIFRAVSMEFRSKQPAQWWRSFWDVAFFAASTTATFLFGVAVGNAMMGMPVGADREFKGTVLDLVQWYPLLTGVFAVSLFAMHGAIYLYLKTEGTLQQRIRGWVWRAFFVFLALYIVVSVVTNVVKPDVTRNFTGWPLAWIVVLLNILAIANIPRGMYRGHPGYAFVSSACTIAALNFLFGIAIFPNLIVSSIDPKFNLTVFNAASSESTLKFMRIIAFMGMPFMLCYTSVIYWVFRGKVTVGKLSY